ncbi:hypothetical protein I302_103208 [Kwoniella bestiolae CBS 10118]|uniref:Uncharacterized protein n=1 Tax=Kwoniella bestiolae CBS 10118 TaxID=1296100 RepID=A0A1B9G7T2_9TREE|nr:hypothetical protein I302_01907 [Kwoniella bestiolae CBS 10118]OCF27072.1 hypothetical protein I302_01907 [Kwoniella bestiolae CBS 10118]
MPNPHSASPHIALHNDVRAPIHPYTPPCFEIDDLDQLGPVHTLILHHYQYVDPITLLRVSRKHYNALIPLVYRKVLLDSRMVDKFFYGMLDTKSDRFTRGEGKLHAIKQIKILQIFDTKSALVFLEECKKFGRARSPLKGVSPFENVIHLRIDQSVLKGYMIAQLGMGSEDFDSYYSERSGPAFAAFEDDKDDSIPNGPFVNTIIKYVGNIKTFCIDYGYGYDWEHTPLGGEVAKISSHLLRSLIKKSPHLKTIVVHADTKDIHEYCKLDFFNLPEDLRNSIKVQFQLIEFEEKDEAGRNVLKWKMYDVWRLYDDLWMFNTKRQQFSFMMKHFTRETIMRNLKKAEKMQDQIPYRNLLTDFGRVAEYTERRVKRFEDFRKCWKFPSASDAGRGEDDLSCGCGEGMFHREAADNHWRWKKPKWARPSFTVPEQVNDLHDSDSDSGSDLEGWAHEMGGWDGAEEFEGSSDEDDLDGHSYTSDINDELRFRF